MKQVIPNYIYKALLILCFCATVCVVRAQTVMYNTKYKQMIFLDDNYIQPKNIAEFHTVVGYEYTFVLDTLDNIVVKSRMRLEVGSGISKFYSESYYILDSLLKANPGKQPVNFRKNLSTDIFPPTFSEAFFYNYPEGKISTIGRIAATDFLVEEEMPAIKWRLEDSTKTLGNLNVNKASCNFRGRHYEAWFCPDIPIPLGPWKFHGLPGLIVQVHDDRGFYRFDIAELDTSAKGDIWMQDYDYLSISLQQYMEARERITANEPLYLNLYTKDTGIQMTPPSTYKKRELGNDFIEVTYE
ncbi:MAG: GLPGLI family protein [Bacteroidales bacterium]|nr:GLPGLI family protein [Bacteroidales bacterium]